MKTTPFVKVNTQNTVGIENVIPKILKPQNQQQKPVVGCAAYLAAKDYFDNLRNRIKAYDPESVVDYYIIDISDHPSRPGSSTDFSVTITTKDGHDKVGSFNVERNDPNQPVDWNNVMDTLANNITSIIKYYKSAPLINEDIETLKQNVNALKQKMTITQSKTKKLEDTTQDEINKTQEILSSKMDNVIETTTDDNVVYYPVLVENTTETSETPELDKAKEELKKKVDSMSEDEICDECINIANKTINHINELESKGVLNEDKMLELDDIEKSLSNIRIYKKKKRIMSQKDEFYNTMKQIIINKNSFDKVIKGLMILMNLY